MNPFRDLKSTSLGLFFKKNLPPTYIFLVSLFFVTHGYSEHVDLLRVKDLYPVFAYILVASGLLFFLFRWLFKDRHKGGLFNLFVMIVVLFYGAIENFFGNFQSLAGISRLRYLMPFLLILLMVVYWLLYKSKSISLRFISFLNILLLLYVAADIVIISFAIRSKNNSPGIATDSGIRFNPPNSVYKPDIYFIVLDEYAGKKSLKKYFGYDNSLFEDTLESEGFRVLENAHGNYVNTPVALASLLNMRYLDHNEYDKSDKSFEHAKRVLHLIENNHVCNLLTEEGYEIRNYSVFNLKGHPSPYKNSFIPIHTNVITEKTLFNRVSKSLVPFLGNEFKISWAQQWLHGDIVRNNEHILTNSLPSKNLPDDQPEFRYIHLMMPHAPFAFDSTGRRMHIRYASDTASLRKIDSAYLQYHVYCSRVITQYVKEIKQATDRKAAVILISDHGYRNAARFGDRSYISDVLFAVYLPSLNYEAWYDSMSHVNLFRSVFNAEFKQKIPLLRDSIAK